VNTLKKTIYLLTLSGKKNAIIMIILILIMAVLDMIGVASIFPFIGVITNPNLVETNIYLSYLYKFTSSFGIRSIEQFIFILGIIVFMILMISLTFRAFMAYLQARFSLMREYIIGKLLIEGYLRQPYSWFLNKNSADLSKNILSEINHIIHQTVVPMMILISQSAIAFALIILLLFVDANLTIIIALVLAISYLLIFRFVKNILSRIGFERFQANTKRFQVITEAFGSIKETKVRGLEQVYINRFAEPSKIYAINQSFAQVISQLPRYFIEGIVFGGMIILLLALIALGGNFSNIIPVLTLYAFAGYRLIPALQQIYYSNTQLSFSESSLDSLYNDLIKLNNIEVEEEKKKIISFTKVIKFNHIYFSYNDDKNTTLEDINITIPAFSKIGIVGPTGCGKTTLVDIMLGLLYPQKGTITADETVINTFNKRSWQKIIGYVPQQIYLADDSLAANIAFGVDKSNIDQNALKQASIIANLHDFVTTELTEGYDTIIGERGVRLSGGQQQRIGIARALYKNPEILILDEATSALDIQTEKVIIKSIETLKKKITIIHITHRLHTVINYDKIFLIEKGRIKAEGNFNQLMLNKNFSDNYVYKN
jgi:ABC-type multidrug transport system fused ATPase/permease subunit